MKKPSDMLARIQRTSVVLAVAAVAVGGIAWGAFGMVSAAAGAALALGNFWAIRRLGVRAVRKVTEGGTPRQALAFVGALTGKMTLLFGLVWVCMRVLGLAVLPFALGISVFVFAILLAGVGMGLRQSEGVF